MSGVGRLARYLAVGATGVGVNFAVLRGVWPLLHGLPAVANAVATEAAIVSNYLLNSRLTFRQPPAWGAFWRYNLVSVAGGALQVGVFTLLVHFGLYYLLANLLAIPLNTAVGFVLSLRWVFRPRPADEAAP
jgi:putative flippase GtrA